MPRITRVVVIVLVAAALAWPAGRAVDRALMEAAAIAFAPAQAMIARLISGVTASAPGSGRHAAGRPLDLEAPRPI